MPSNDYTDGDEPEGLDEVIMAIDMKENGSVGSAYYVAIDEALFLQEDVPMAGKEFVETLLLHVEPTTVLISLRSPDSLVEFLEAGAQDFEGNREGIGFLPKKQRRANLCFRGLPWCLRLTYLGIFGVQLRQCQEASHEPELQCLIRVPPDSLHHRGRGRNRRRD